MTKYFGILRRGQDLSIKLSRFRAMSHNMEGGNERSEMIKKVEEASKLNPERLKKVDGNCFSYFLPTKSFSIDHDRSNRCYHPRDPLRCLFVQYKQFFFLSSVLFSYSSTFFQTRSFYILSISMFYNLSNLVSRMERLVGK